MSGPLKILIIRVSSIGDVIHTLPSLFLLKIMLPHAHISWVVQEKAASLLQGQPWIDSLWILPNNYLYPAGWPTTWKIVQEMRSHHWDAIIDFQGLFKTSAIISCLKGPTFGFAPGHARARLSCLTSTHQIVPAWTNIIQKNLSLASAVIGHLAPELLSSPTIDQIHQSGYLNFSPSIEHEINSWTAQNQANNAIVLSPNTTWQSKMWPLEYWKKLITEILLQRPATPCLLIGAHMGGQATELAQWIHSEKNNVIIAPAWNLLHTAAYLRIAQAIVAPDTGMLHLADFLRISTIGLYGPTDAAKHGPFLSGNKSLQAACPHLYKKTHIQAGQPNRFDCMSLITPEMVIERLNIKTNITKILHPQLH